MQSNAQFFTHTLTKLYTNSCDQIGKMWCLT